MYVYGFIAQSSFTWVIENMVSWKDFCFWTMLKNIGKMLSINFR